jgi:hypothetical protein
MKDLTNLWLFEGQKDRFAMRRREKNRNRPDGQISVATAILECLTLVFFVSVVCFWWMFVL